MDISVFLDLFALDIKCMPIIWDEQANRAKKHPERSHLDINEATVRDLLSKDFKDANGIAISVVPPLGMIDFDIKNTDNKKLFDQWRDMVLSNDPDALRHTFIEQTRSGGYHVYFKYDKLSHKIAVARETDGNGKPQETISVYTGGLLSYCYPTPKYIPVHNDWNDVDFINDATFDLFVSCGAYFNKYEPEYHGEKTITSYPQEYENTCLQFDAKIPDDAYEALLNSIGLVKCADQRRYEKKKFIAYLRQGSTADYSAKVYWSSRKLLIFSSSMSDFPTWADAIKNGDKSWSLTPSKILFYKNKRDWANTIDEINCICDSACIDIEQPAPITKHPIVYEADRMQFPYDIFPEHIQNFIQSHSIQHEYIAMSILGACSAAIGNSAQLEALNGYIVKPILYGAIVAPPGSAKSPALKIAFAPLFRYNKMAYAAHKEEMNTFRGQLAAAKATKTADPEQPALSQVIIEDSTIEMVIKILSNNPMGCIIYADELSGFLNRMNQYKQGDEVEKWLSLWNGNSILLQRISRDHNYVENPFCSILGGIQPGVLHSLSKSDNQFNGFYHRFLFCYPTPQDKADFGKLTPDSILREYYHAFMNSLLSRRGRTETYMLHSEALALYKEWFANKNQKYNIAQDDNIKGIIAKYQDYCLRLALIIQIMNETEPTGLVWRPAMNAAIRLTEYFFGNMYKAMQILTPASPIDTLPDNWKTIYAALPPSFSTKTFLSITQEHRIKDNAAKAFLSRNVKKLFTIIQRGEYEKIY